MSSYPWRPSNYLYPECATRLENRCGPDHISHESCPSCDWSKVYDTYETPVGELDRVRTATDGGQPTDENDYRILAPRRNTVTERRVEPDWLWSVSGGLNSVAAYLVTRRALHENYQKRPLMVYLDTRIGIPLNRLYVEQLADQFEEQIWTCRTEWKFEDYLKREDAPGPGAHEDVRKGLKGRQSSTLITKCDFPVVVQGISADESEHRASLSKWNEKKRHWEVYPVHRLTRKQQAEIVLRSDAPINPLWCFPEIFTDCGCGANGDPKEFDRVQELFPIFIQRLREYEEAIDADGVRDTLGWGGLTATEQSAREQGHEQTTLTTCGVGCQRSREPTIVRAFKARVRGATKDEAIQILHGGSAADVQEVSAADAA